MNVKTTRFIFIGHFTFIMRNIRQISSWFEAYFRCMVKHGEEIPYARMQDIIMTYWGGSFNIHGLHSMIVRMMPFLTFNECRDTKDRVYVNTLGDKYGEPFPPRVRTDDGYRYDFDYKVSPVTAKTRKVLRCQK